MFNVLRSPVLTRFVLLTAVGLAPVEWPLFCSFACLANPLTSQDYGSQDPGGQDMPDLDPFGQVPGDDLVPRRSPRAKTAKKKSVTSAKGSTDKAGASNKSKSGAAKKGTGDTGQLKFSQDIAPILVAANCIGCHSGDRPGLVKGKLDLTTFETLKKGSQKRTEDQAVVIAGKPDESHLVMRINGDEEPAMPQGGNNPLSDEAIKKIKQWVKEGAKLDAGLDAKKPITSYAASPEQVARNKTARLPAEARDKLAQTVGVERWKQANPKLKPETEHGEHFLMFSNLPSDRAKTTVKAMETQYGHLKKLLGSPATDWPEKLSLYVFSNRKDFIEFVRTLEGREVEADIQSSAKFSMAQPYLAVVDPAGGKKEEAAAGKRKAKSKRGETKDVASGGADRTLAGMLTEALGTNVVAASGAPPRWLALGIGTYLAAHVEPRSPYYQHMRETALAEFGQGWNARATEALGATDQVTASALHAIGFALVEAMMSGMSQGFPEFVQGMLAGGDKLDDALKNVYGGTRDDFLQGTGDWVARHYGRLQ